MLRAFLKEKLDICTRTIRIHANPWIPVYTCRLCSVGGVLIFFCPSLTLQFSILPSICYSRMTNPHLLQNSCMTSHAILRNMLIKIHMLTTPIPDSGSWSEYQTVNYSDILFINFFNNFFFQINIDVIRPLVSPPLPPVLVEPLFAAFDENQVINSINLDRIKPLLRRKKNRLAK